MTYVGLFRKTEDMTCRVSQTVDIVATEIDLVLEVFLLKTRKFSPLFVCLIWYFKQFFSGF